MQAFKPVLKTWPLKAATFTTNLINYLTYNTMGTPIIPDEIVMNQIYYIRGQKDMIDPDLEVLYNVEKEY